VLYWLVNNVLSIAQQWQINGAIERANQKHGRGAKA
jgi:membrane protein insertase Oxa1/YidC/SpoIIIJ